MAVATPPAVLPDTARKAWNEYLAITVRAGYERCYDEVEPWAWQRLKAKLGAAQGGAREPDQN